MKYALQKWWLIMAWSSDSSLCVIIWSAFRSPYFGDDHIPNNVNKAGEVKMSQLKFWTNLDPEIRQIQATQAASTLINYVSGSGVLHGLEDKYINGKLTYTELLTGLKDILAESDKTLNDIYTYFDDKFRTIDEIE
ncbi:hypothetical protein [Enterovibrio sp. 27052020O]|uniref:hypothetical protein n=1 Tax=Enterovibrio sp. 27052020O TaxID=3241166 RepID=UPI00388F05B6